MNNEVVPVVVSNKVKYWTRCDYVIGDKISRSRSKLASFTKRDIIMIIIILADHLLNLAYSFRTPITECPSVLLYYYLATAHHNYC